MNIIDVVKKKYLVNEAIAKNSASKEYILYCETLNTIFSKNCLKCLCSSFVSADIILPARKPDIVIIETIEYCITSILSVPIESTNQHLNLQLVLAHRKRHSSFQARL